MWFIGVEVEKETSASPPKKNPGSAPAQGVAYKRGSNTPNGNLTKECNHQLKEIQLH